MTDLSSGGVGVVCPHCEADNPAGAAFCEQCGKAISTGATSGPRVVEGAGLARQGVGRDLQAADLKKKARSAAGALLAVAILMTLGCGLVYFMVKDYLNDPEVSNIAKTMIASQIGLTIVYYGLWLWARKNPLPAAIVGLVLFISVWFVNAIMDPTTIMSGIIVKVIVIVVLSKAIQAGMQHRQLMRERGLS